ncbi:MAG: RecQ family zinc-binding domain-containing protein [Muribaculaceae bacterium]|nr:RecQ family zinc-binding domain-containing protein [Muribaculaceae bacterium]
MKRRLDAMARFAFDDSGCRVNGLLRYFGEEPSEPCGKCDYCRAMKRDRRLSGQTAMKAVMTVLSIESPIGIGQLIANANRSPEDVMTAVRELCDEGVASMNGGMVSLTDR